MIEIVVVLFFIILFFLIILLPFIWLYKKENGRVRSIHPMSIHFPTIEIEDEQQTYSDLLRKDEWKSKREELLLECDSQCQWCKSTNNLQVHHKYYVMYPNGQKVMPWDYPNKAFMVLCDKCHKKYHEKYNVKVYRIPYNGIRYNI